MRFLTAILFIPWLGLYLPVGFAPIASGVHDTGALGAGVARLEGMTWGPDVEQGRIVIIGHNPGAFSNLVHLRKANTEQRGDQILLYYDDGTVQEFEVFAMYTTTRGDTTILKHVPRGLELALITCWGPDKSLVVRAQVVE